MYIYTHTRTLKPRSILRVERVLQGSKIARERVKLEISRFNEFNKKKKKKKMDRGSSKVFKIFI